MRPGIYEFENDGSWRLEVLEGGGSMLQTTGVKDACPDCGAIDCYGDCGSDRETDNEALDRQLYNASIDGIESLVLALAEAGVDVIDPRFQEGLSVALDSCAQNFPG